MESELLYKAKKTLHKQASVTKAKILQSFFKTGKGQYGEGDIFIGVTVPQVREIAKQFSDLKQDDILKLLHSKIHEERLLALFIWIIQYQKGNEKIRAMIVADYIKNTRYINNWDLVDLSAPKIIGDFLSDKKHDILYSMAKSSLLWDRRIAVVATYAFIREQRFEDTFKLTEKLLKDKEDLMHKACGWMLRECGKRNENELKRFLQKYYRDMPRTMLRYAIERFDEKTRKNYITGTV